MPLCGDFGHDDTAANPHRPCEACGIAHAMTCPNMPSVTDERTTP